TLTICISVISFPVISAYYAVLGRRSCQVDVFEIQHRLVEEYKSYVESFVSIRDPRIFSFVQRKYDGAEYWPEALVQLNPAFEKGSSVQELVDGKVVHPRCADIFQVGDQSMRLCKH